MTVLLPLDCRDKNKALLSSLENKQTFALLNLEEGEIVSCVFYDNKEDISEFIEFLIVINKEEDVESFIDEGVMVLVAFDKRTISEVIEAFLFTELHTYIT